MLLAKLQNDQIIDIADHRILFPNVSFRNDGIEEDFLIANNCVPVETYRAYNSSTHSLESCAAYLEDGIVYTAKVVELSDTEIAQKDSRRVATLWQAAHDYEFNAISGTAIGLLVQGVMQNKPKCVAFQNWLNTLWAEYYNRKDNGSYDFDFSSIGEKPYSIPELIEELSS